MFLVQYKKQWSISELIGFNVVFDLWRPYTTTPKHVDAPLEKWLKISYKESNT